MVGEINRMHAAVVVGGCAAVGIVGLIGESFSKDINKKSYPKLRTIGEIFCKIIQSILPALAVMLLLADRKVHGAVITTLFSAIILTPIVNGIASHTSYNNFQNKMNKLDKGVSALIKTINTAGAVVAVVAYFERYGLALGLTTGLVFGALSVNTVLKG